ncbi:aromatic acid exporter family protein [Clostridium sp. AL.422]|uniref:FUSC family protein n=1 Tax=Clostridium TaxID=1485 RepID=UPI00293DF7FF|nr:MULTISPECIES: FUSC family protein [unclassified Clostridium]MDV4150182.1 aromatic acid exporter family protein [Clostridium sp. AL.422]
MENFEIPHIGSRNIKTALSVLICLILWPNSLFAAIAAVICVQSTVENSLKIGINRLIGTLLGGIISLILLYAVNSLNLEKFLPLIVATGVSLIIYICNLIKKPSACSISSITLMAILISHNSTDPLMYAVHRTIETAFGVIVAILINKYINPPKTKNTVEKTN